MRRFGSGSSRNLGRPESGSGAEVHWVANPLKLSRCRASRRSTRRSSVAGLANVIGPGKGCGLARPKRIPAATSDSCEVLFRSGDQPDGWAGVTLGGRMLQLAGWRAYACGG